MKVRAGERERERERIKIERERRNLFQKSKYVKDIIIKFGNLLKCILN
jgi:hypothetical protein